MSGTDPLSGTDPVLDVVYAGLSDPGPHRSNNEDRIGFCVPDDPVLMDRKGVLYVVADGVGGHQGGEVASATAVDTVIKEYYSPSSHSRLEPALRQSVQIANLRLHDLGQGHLELRQMETTLTALVLAGDRGYVAHIGDSRLYHFRGGRLSPVTSDHSEVADLVRMRLVNPESARTHPGRNVLTRTLGGRLIVRPDFVELPVQPGDQFLLCTDGLWSEVSDEEIAETLRSCEPENACRVLLDMALDRDCVDNVSVQVIKVRSVAPSSPLAQSRDGWLSSVIDRIRGT